MAFRIAQTESAVRVTLLIFAINGWGSVKSDAAATISLKHERVLFPLKTEKNVTPRQFNARVLPGGTKLLFFRQPVSDFTSRNPGQAPAEVILHDLRNAKESILDVGGVDGSSAYLAMIFPVSDQKGRLLLLPDFREEPPKFGGDLTRPLLLFECATARRRETGIKADFRHSKIDSAGTVLVGGGDPQVGGGAMWPLDRSEPQHHHAPGLLDSLSPTAPVGFFENRRKISKQEVRGDLFLWDLRNDQLICEVANDVRNRRYVHLSQWTLDGNCMYFNDSLPNELTDEHWRLCAWDVKTRRTIRTWKDGFPVGPGPGTATMIVSNGFPAESVFLHDPRTDQVQKIELLDRAFIHAWGSLIVFVKKIDGVESLCAAELDVKASPKPSR
jgi:hypothetical protein